MPSIFKGHAIYRNTSLSQVNIKKNDISNIFFTFRIYIFSKFYIDILLWEIESLEAMG